MVSQLLTCYHSKLITWIFWVGICKANAIALLSKLSSKDNRAPWTPDSNKWFAYSYNRDLQHKLYHCFFFQIYEKTFVSIKSNYHNHPDIMLEFPWTFSVQFTILLHSFLKLWFYEFMKYYSRIPKVSWRVIYITSKMIVKNNYEDLRKTVKK